ncbi:MAG TPA: class I SAM-dependent methyltransferase [Bacillota bacterium]|nr:class I SAM-dependent methyltransferase [Bacillota bacterium]HOQ03373.1 class I SAM-dependent methyltransferase [Bacillota bacterium]HPP61133.1 class I SAM-dependent methyltransferase [Bacillota bacterium]HPV13710.1 class I SAM-dependent methyltransferase [Bacillota bacterium]
MQSKRPYAGFAKIYDDVMSDVPYDEWLDYVMAIWEYHSFSPETVLDLACGTGNMSIRLARKGYKVTGVDSSPQMLEVAKEKAEREGLSISFINQDMRTLKIEEQFDSVICLFDSLNYLLEPSDVKSCFRSVFDVLKPGGYFIFDMNTYLRLSTVGKETLIFDGSCYFAVWQDYWDKRNKWWQVNLTGFTKEGECWHRFDEIHRERAFPLEDIAMWLEESGFTIRGVYDSTAMMPASPVTMRAYFACYKPEIEAQKCR